MAEPIISQDFAIQILKLLERFIVAYERRLDFEERRDVRIAETAEIRNQLALRRLKKTDEDGETDHG